MKKLKDHNSVVFLNPRTCGIYKSGSIRYKTDAATGKRTKDVDNEMLEVVDSFLQGQTSDAIVKHPLKTVLKQNVLVPRYYDERWNADFFALTKAKQLDHISIKELIDIGYLEILNGHGSPPNDQRTGNIPYIKVSDIRCLMINVNPTNLVSEAIAKKFWGSDSSGLQEWDLLTPNRASSNIGEFAILLPGEERILLTKEVFVFRLVGGQTEGWDPFYLFWALCLKAVRNQWQRITLMQTNREDCGDRYLEVLLPKPKSAKWAKQVSEPFRSYFQSMAVAKRSLTAISESGFQFIASVRSDIAAKDEPGTDDTTETD